MNRLAHKVPVTTGADRGLGRAAGTKRARTPAFVVDGGLTIR